MTRYFIGYTRSFLQNKANLMTLEDLHNDSRLIINHDELIFAEEKHINQLEHSYELDNLETVYEWIEQNDYYSLLVVDEIHYDNLADYQLVDKSFGDSINKLNKEELQTCNLEDLYVKCAKKIILDELKKEIVELEKEWAV